MELLILNPFFHPYLGGTEKHILQVGRRLARHHSISVLTSRLQGTPERETIEGIEVIRSPARVLYAAPHPLPPPVPLFSGLEGALRKALSGKSILHLHNRFVYSHSHIRMARQMGAKALLTLHNSRPERIDLLTDVLGGAYDDLIGKRLMRSCHGVSAVSAATMEATMPKDYPGWLEVIHNGVDQDLFRPSGSKGAWPERFDQEGLSGPIILTNARLLPQKGLCHLIDALQGMDASLVVFGRGPLERSLRSRAKSKGVRSCFMAERISDEDLSCLYRSCDIFSLPSLYEPCAVALLEAMASGMPIVASDAGGNPELVLHGKSGLIAEAGSKEALADALGVLISEPAQGRRLGKGARERVLQDFTWDLTAERFESFYQRFSD